MDEINFKAQPGPQEQFLATDADIALYGGAAGGGKSFALMLEPLFHIDNPQFGAVCFRRTIPQIKNEGGLWDESMKIYPYMNAKPNMTELFWKFPSGCTVSFSHLEHEKNIFDYQGAQIPLILFDELTHFTKKQFFYMLSRNRSTSGIKPYIRCTTNPDKKSWVRPFIDWWLFPQDHPLHGIPDPDKAGVIRWFIIEDDKVIWRDRKEDFDDPTKAKSFTFIPAKLSDNKILMQKDPGYLANLHALPRAEREKLLDGNWDAEEKAGELFKREKFKVVDTSPAHTTNVVRYWDRAASESDTADYTVGIKMAKLDDGKFIVLNMVRFRGTPSKVEAAVKNTASQDGRSCTIWLEQDPGQAGKMEAEYLAGRLAGFSVKLNRATESKAIRAQPASSQAEVGNIIVLAGSWNEDFFTELEAFPAGSHDDIVDAFSGAFNALASGNVGTFTDKMAPKIRTPGIGRF